MKVGAVIATSCSTPNGPRLKVLAYERGEEEPRPTELDAREVEELRDACDEFLAGRRV